MPNKSHPNGRLFRLLLAATILFGVLPLLYHVRAAEMKPADMRLTYYEGNNWGFIDGNGKVVIKAIYYLAEPFRKGLAKVSVQTGTNRWRSHYIDRTGKRATPPKAWVRARGTFADKDGNVFPLPQPLLNAQYKHPIAHGVWRYIPRGQDNGLHGICDYTGKLLVTPKYRFIGPYNDGLAQIKRDDKWGYIDDQGKEAISPQYLGASRFSEGLARVTTAEGRGYINTKGVMVISDHLEGYEPFIDGLAAVKGDKGWGFIDKKGAIVIATRYEEVRPFSEGLAAVKIGGRFGFIDRTGKMVIPARFFRVKSFKRGFAIFRVAPYARNIKGCIDRTGKIVLKADYQWIIPYEDGLFLIRQRGRKGLWGVRDQEGKYLIEPKYCGIVRWTSEGGVYHVSLGSETNFIHQGKGWLDAKGKVIWMGKGSIPARGK
jgi:WG containing repeat